MTPEQIEHALRGRFHEVEIKGTHWEIMIDEKQLVVLADTESDRMRIMMPVAVVDRPDATAFERLLKANFVTTLDARYALHDDVVWVVYLASLSGLSAHLFDSALSQVMELAKTTGDTFTATPTLLGAGVEQLH